MVLVPRETAVEDDVVDVVARLKGVEVDVVDQGVCHFEGFEVRQTCEVEQSQLRRLLTPMRWCRCQPPPSATMPALMSGTSDTVVSSHPPRHWRYCFPDYGQCRE